MEFSGCFDAPLSVSLRIQQFLLAPRSQGRFARRKVCDLATEIPYWWRRPIRAPVQIPDRFYVISMEFLSLSRRRSSWRNVLSGGARRNGCTRMLMIRLILDHKNHLIPKERTPISGCRCFTFFAARFSWRADRWPDQQVHFSASFLSVPSGRKRKSLESIILFAFVVKGSVGQGRVCNTFTQKVERFFHNSRKVLRRWTFHSHVVRLFSCIQQPCRDLFKILMVFLTAARVAQLDKREVAGSNSRRTSTQGLKITEENVLPLLRHLQMVRHSSLLG